MTLILHNSETSSAIEKLLFNTAIDRFATVGSWDGGVRVWNPVTERVEAVIDMPAGTDVVIWSNNSSTFAGEHDRFGGSLYSSEVYVRDAESQLLLLVYEPEQCASVEHLALSPDGTQLAVSCGAGWDDRGAPTIIDVATGEAVETFNGLTGHLIEWSPDGQMLLVVGDDGLLQLYDAESGELNAISHEKYRG